MRACSKCGAPDRAVLDPDAPCGKNCDPSLVTWDVATHSDDCPKLIHEVRRLFKRVQLVATPAKPGGDLPMKYRLEGWTVVKDGPDVFRAKMLCRRCIDLEYERDRMQRDYQAACKRARGVDDRSYGQMMLRQAQ